MNSKIAYQAAYEGAVQSLVGLTKSLEKYIEKSAGKTDAGYVQRRKEQIARIGAYIKAAHLVFAELEEEVSDAYKRGVRRGKEMVEGNGQNHSYRETHSTYFDMINSYVGKETLQRLKDKELKRAMSKMELKERCPELF